MVHGSQQEYARGASGNRSLLAVTSEVPWPLDSGGHLRTYHVLSALASRFDVRLVAPNRGEDGRRAFEAASVETHFVDVPRRTALSEALRMAGAAIRHEPYVLYGRHRWRQVACALARQAADRRPDALYLDHLDSLVYAGAVPGVPIVIDMHNVYSRLALRASREAVSVLRRRYLAAQAAQLARMERRAVQLADTICVVSDEEGRYFSALGARRVAVVPNGVSCATFDRLPLAARSGPGTILYVGSLAWAPNITAAQFLITNVLPAVRRSIPDAALVIIGRNPPKDLAALATRTAGVTLAANVPDVIPYLRAAHVLAVPLEAGGGTRLKILEAFAAGLPVVSTPVGCEGIDATSGTHLIVAERADFARALVELLNDQARCRQLAGHARRLARDHYDWSVVGALACRAVADTVGSAPDPVARQVRRVLDDARQERTA